MVKIDIVIRACEIITPPIMTFLAGWLGLKYGLEQIKVQRNFDFINKQLQELYFPLLGYVVRIKARTSLRKKVHDAAGQAW